MIRLPAAWSVILRLTSLIIARRRSIFARGFEAYLAEGEAPSKEMLGVFRRFKAWMTEIYKSVTELEVELSPEIRRVFDCMWQRMQSIKS